MLHYSTILQPTMMKQQQQQECSEIHTIQMFREASSCIPCSSLSQGDQQSSHSITMSSNNSMRITPISDKREEIACGIGGDWAIEMDEDLIEEPSTTHEMATLNSEGETSLYSFYFETPVVSMGQDESSDEFTLTSQETESLYDSNDFDFDSMDDIWERGLTRTLSYSEGEKIVTTSTNQFTFMG
uniref:Uncharacterized protein n=1 Tax=Pseudo-nitzschia australis TaxID=44445 RepID=A0A7S4EMI3_9STRA|mmetsp:Transcript_74/g.188  ORF Transcript_74/g.188 Transcript_74/m.188 type:complete len:185 (+) Transcript_74:162-716(+)